MAAGKGDIFDRKAIAAVLPRIDMVAALEPAFAALSAGGAQLAAVGELLFSDPPGDVHVKAGHIAGDAHFVVKVASGFYDNGRLGLPSSSGLSLLFDARTGGLSAILLDDGMLTDERTGGAGAVAAKYLAPADPLCIGILGAGIQAEQQLRHLLPVTGCRSALIWARRADAAEALAERVRQMGYSAVVAESPAALAAQCRLIVTTTPSAVPLLDDCDIMPGTHITAVGADGDHKAELSDALIERADLRVADSIAQCRERGEFRRLSEAATLVELGDVIAGRAHGRTAPDQITIADLTGVAVQDAAIAKAVVSALQHQQD